MAKAITVGKLSSMLSKLHINYCLISKVDKNIYECNFSVLFSISFSDKKDLHKVSIFELHDHFTTYNFHIQQFRMICKFYIQNYNTKLNVEGKVK